MIGTDAFQETDVFGVTLSLTKWSRLVRTIDEIPEVIAEGFHWARSGRPGPVVIDIPTDMLKAKKEFFGPVKFTPMPALPSRGTAQSASRRARIQRHNCGACCNAHPSQSRWWVREQSFREQFRSCADCSTI